MHKWARPLVAFVILSVSMLLLSAIVDNLSPYLVVPDPQERGPSERRVHLTEDERLSPLSKMLMRTSRLIFVVSPANPVLYWRTFTADYYDGLGWYRTTREITTETFPSINRGNATQVFTVEYNMTEEEIWLPVPPPQNDLTQLVLSPLTSHEYYFDEIGDTYGIRILGASQETMIAYQAGWHYTEIDKWRVSLEDIPQEIQELYLQLPSLPIEVKELSESLKRPRMNPVDQILSDVAYFLTNFEYDLDYYMGRTRRTITQDWVLSYLRWRKGICVDAATALAVILRCQGIPSRISLGYKPTRVVGDAVLYYSNTSHAETEAYLPPYGWVRFDATPFSPLDLPEDVGALRPEKGLALEISPIEAEGYPGESIFYHLMVNNSRETKDHLELSIYNTNGWDCEVTPGSLLIRAYEPRDALVEVKIPENASYGQVNAITVTATSAYDPDVTVSNTTIARVREVRRAPTTTTITYFNDSVFRGDSFYVEGTVFTTYHEPVHDMPVLILFKENKEAKGTVCGNGLSQYGLFRIGGEVPFDTELGDYAVVAISLGTTEYAPSSSDPTITVAARTYTELDIHLEDVRVTRPFLVEDHILISGFLRLDNGTTVSGATLELEILAPEPPTSTRHKIIAENGFFVKKFIFWTPGTYELNVTFPGRGYIASSCSYRIIEVGSPSIHLLTEDYGVRGEVLRISGNVSSNHGAIPGEPVTITFDGEALETVETGPNGTFFYNFETKSEVQPGWHLLAYTLQKRNGIGTTQYIRLMVKSEVTTSATEKVTSGDSFTCTISLRDDQGFPIVGEEISVGNYGLSAKTDKGGNVEFMLDTLPLWWRNINFSVTFKGSEEYLPSTTCVMVNVQPGFTSLLFVLMTSALLILGLTIYRETSKRVFHEGKSDEAELEEIYTNLKKEVVQTEIKKKHALRIDFPDIRPSFPSVWGIRDTLRIECIVDRGPRTRLERNEIELFVNDERVGKDRSYKDRPATFSHVFNEKGEHEVGARLIRKARRKPIKVDAKLRIVDYREEIIRLYKRFLQYLVHQSVDLKASMTAREVENLLLDAVDFDPENLNRVIDCFERAEYSAHEVSRENYETIYLSLKELIIDVD